MASASYWGCKDREVAEELRCAGPLARFDDVRDRQIVNPKTILAFAARTSLLSIEVTLRTMIVVGDDLHQVIAFRIVRSFGDQSLFPYRSARKAARTWH